MKCVMIILLSIIRCHFSNETIQTTTTTITTSSTKTNITHNNNDNDTVVPFFYFLPLQQRQYNNGSIVGASTTTTDDGHLHLIQNTQPHQSGQQQLPLPKTTLSRVVETKYGKVQGLSVTLFPSNSGSSSNSGNSGSTNEQGSNSNTRNYFQHPLRNKMVEVFLSVPYASPPIKSNRFSPTQTPIPWEGIRQVIKPGFVCPQALPDIRDENAALKEMPKYYFDYLRKVEPFLRNQSEDCLYLNIFSPISIARGEDAENSKSDSMKLELKPVLVFIHGGKFSWGSGNLYDGTFLASYANILVVTLNYRLGVLGFLNMNPSPNIKPRVANFGLMDQIGALHWMKENIALFGGDPDNITLMGYEAGAASIHFLMSSPAVVPGLFHRCILIAGSSKAPWAISEDPFMVAISLADSLNCSIKLNSTKTNSSTSSSSSFSTYLETITSSFTGAAGVVVGEGDAHLDKKTISYITDSLLDCFRTKHFSYFTKFLPPKFSVDFAPSVDGVVVLPNFWTTESQSGKRDFKSFDVFFGLSSLEMLYEFTESDLSNGFEIARRDAILRTLVRNSYKFHRNEILATISNEYVDWERNVQHPISARDSTLSAITDCLSLSPLIAITDSAQIKKSYFYVFEHSSKDGPSTFQKSGGANGEELNYFFGFPLVETILPFFLSSPFFLLSNYTNAEIALSEILINYLSNFVHSGNPNEPNKGDSIWPISNEKNKYKNLIWEPYDRLHQKYLEITANKLRIRSHYRSHQMGIWQNLIPELERSGAQYASVLHNQMKGGYDRSLYVGRLKLPEEIEAAHRAAGDFDDFYLNGSSINGNGIGGGIRPSPPTTCFSSLSSIYSDMGRGNGNVGAVAVEERKQDTSSSTSSISTSLEMSFMSPYVTALSITIAVGCSLLILNILIFALLYYRSTKQRNSSNSNSSGRESASTDSQLQQLHHQHNYNFSSIRETPELLNSNSTTATSFHHSQSTDSCRNPDDQYHHEHFHNNDSTLPNDVNFFSSSCSSSYQQHPPPQHNQAGKSAKESLCVIPLENQQHQHQHHPTVHFAQDLPSCGFSNESNEQLILSSNNPAEVYIPKNSAASAKQSSYNNKITLQRNHQSNIFQSNKQQEQQQQQKGQSQQHIFVNLGSSSHQQQQQPLEVSTLSRTTTAGIDKIQLPNHSATLQKSATVQKPAPPRRTSASNYVTQRQILSVIMTALIFGFL